MHRLRQWLSNGLTALSLLLCLAMATLWVRCYWIEDRVYARYALHYFYIVSYRGEIGCEFGAIDPGSPQDLYTPSWVAGYHHVPVNRIPQSDYIQVAEAQGRFNNLPHYHNFLGFRFHPRTDGNPDYGVDLVPEPNLEIRFSALAFKPTT